jgi:hypothetical protein
VTCLHPNASGYNAFMSSPRTTPVDTNGPLKTVLGWCLTGHHRGTPAPCPVTVSTTVGNSTRWITCDCTCHALD